MLWSNRFEAFVFGEQFFDPGLVLYIYESPPGYGILALRVLAWVYFSYACFFTVKHYPEKSKFYYPFYIFYTIWYVDTDLVIGGSVVEWLERWTRDQEVAGSTPTAALFGQQPWASCSHLMCLCSPSSIIWYLARAFMLMRRNVAAGIGSTEQGEYCRAALQRSDRKEQRYKWPTLVYFIGLWLQRRKLAISQCRSH